MSHAHNNYMRPRKFRVFVTNRYWANRDEYDGAGQQQPYKAQRRFELSASKYNPSVHGVATGSNLLRKGWFKDRIDATAAGGAEAFIIKDDLIDSIGKLQAETRASKDYFVKPGLFGVSYGHRDLLGVTPSKKSRGGGNGPREYVFCSMFSLLPLL